MGLVQCRVCKQKFDKSKLKEDVDWVMPSRNWYYHKKCYNDWKRVNTNDETNWVGLIYDFLAHDLKVSYDYYMCEAQRKKFVNSKKYTNKGIYFTLKYFYEIKKGDWEKSNGGIGIIPYVYSESVEYWVRQEQQSRGVMAEIEKQMQERANRKVIKINRRKNTPKNKNKFNLDDIAKGEVNGR